LLKIAPFVLLALAFVFLLLVSVLVQHCPQLSAFFSSNLRAVGQFWRGIAPNNRGNIGISIFRFGERVPMQNRTHGIRCARLLATPFLCLGVVGRCLFNSDGGFFGRFAQA
jgi:hypothetical protein